jgi:ABC-type Fe3+ transport system substrate-binding protein
MQSDGKIVLATMGSREGRDHVLYNKEKVHPAVWSPGDIYWIGKLQSDANDPAVTAKSGASVNDPKRLLNTYVVFLMPEDKAKLFEAASAKPEYAGKSWKLIHELATKGWSSIGGSADAGKLKLAQTDPTKSNSGMSALILMYQEWVKDNPGKSINDKGFLQWMGEIQSAVAEFPAATSKQIETFVSNPGSADTAIVYESDAVRAIDNGAQGMRIVYPSPTVAITVPASVVKAEWVSPEQEALGAKFVDYLMTDAVQEQAIKAGYRPANPTLSAKVTEMVTAKQGVGVVATPKVADPADTKTREGLIFNWDQWHKK